MAGLRCSSAAGRLTTTRGDWKDDHEEEEKKER